MKQPNDLPPDDLRIDLMDEDSADLWEEFCLFTSDHQWADKIHLTYDQWLMIRHHFTTEVVVGKDELDARSDMMELLVNAATDGVERAPMRLSKDALLGLAGTVVKTVLPHTEASEAGLLLTFLTMFGSAVGANAWYSADGKHPPRLYTAIVGDTARARKQATFVHLYNIFEEVDPTWALDCVKTGLSTGEGLAEAVKPSGDYDDQDGSIRVGIDGRLLLREPELARVFAVAKREGSTASAIMRDLWDSDRISIIRRDSPVDQSGIHMSVIGHITPDELRDKLATVDIMNGFANRFLYVYVERSKLLPEGGKLSGNTRTYLAGEVRVALERASKLVGVMTRTDEARVMWEALYRHIDRRKIGGLWGSAIARAEAQMTRLQVVYALLDGSSEIGPEHVRAAWAVWRYCEWSAGTLFGVGTGDTTADRLHEAILKAGRGGLSHSEQNGLFRKNKSSKELADARQVLKRLGLIREEEVPSGRGRPKKVSISSSFAKGG